jgi:DNA polymerase I-like protein with 3'-5' exonuclease and polymerase domains
MEDPDQALAYVRHQAAHYRGEVVGAKLSYDIDFLAEAGVVFPHATFRDVQVAEPLLDELQLSYSLDNILARHGLPGKDEALLREAASIFKCDPKRDLHQLPARYVGPYAEADATRPLTLLKRQEALIDAQGLRRIWDMESALLPVLVRMRRRGVRVDFDRLDQVERFARAEEDKAWGELHRLTGVAIRVGDGMKVNEVARALMAVGITPGRTATGKPSITKDWLATLDHPAGQLIRRARKMSQLRTTFVASIREHAIGDRVHCTFNQTIVESDSGETEGARPGRLSCVDPNMQQQPTQDPEIGPMWRAIYVAEDDAIWGQMDYSQQEPRGALHFAIASGAERLGTALGSASRGAAAYSIALEAQRRYREDPSTDSHTMFTIMVFGPDVVNRPDFKQIRDRCKRIFLGICYGMGGPKLCRQLGLPTKIIVHERTGRRTEVAGEEGQALLNLVDQRAPYLRATARAVEEVAKERGYVVTVGGRHCHFPKDAYGNYDWTFKAFNRAIQGTAADQTKHAMICLDREGVQLQLQVHDELDHNLASVEEGRRHAKMMEECFPLNVPSKVDFEYGPSWGQLQS